MPPPSRHVGVAQVDEALLDVRLHPLDGLLEHGGHDEAKDQRVRGALDDPAQQSPVAATVGRGRQRRRPGLDLDREAAGPRAGLDRPGTPAGIDRQVPGVDAIALEQDHRVLVVRHVDLELHSARRGRRGLEAPAATGREVDRLHEVELGVP